MKIAVYARVSTDDQTVENQIQELNKVIQSKNWEVVKIYKDEGISGAKGRDKRPGFDALLKGIEKKEFDLVVTWSVDRLGRSLIDLIGFLSLINKQKIDLYMHVQGVDTTTPGGRAMFQILGVFAEFERAMIQERIKAGMRRVKAQGKQLGRPTVGLEKEMLILSMRADNKSIHKIATALNIGRSAVQRVLSQR